MSNLELFKPKKNVEVLRLPFPKGRAISVGDAHGCLAELEELIGKLAITQDDTVVFLGDLVDRGPNSEGVVQLVKSLSESFSVYCVASNHDEKAIRYHYHQLKAKEDPKYKVPMRCPSSYLELSESSLEFLAKMPHAVFMDNEGAEEKFPLCFVHAGLSPAKFHQD